MPLTRKAYRAAILHSIADPAEVGIEASYEYFEDGLLVVDGGKISALGHASELLPTLPWSGSKPPMNISRTACW